MDLLWIVLLGLLIGAVLGGLGGGGAILTVPVLVYIVGQSGQAATTSSLVIVGLSAAVGVLSYLSARRVRWGLGLAFGLIGLPATFLGSFLNQRVDENVLLLGFSGLMVVAALAMVVDNARTHESDTTDGVTTEPGATPAARPSPAVVVAVALAVGLLTGFFGVGGGFVIVPALVLALRLPIQQAVGTSLMIVALNSATALVSRAGTAHFDWAVIIPFTLAAMVATLIGKRVADRLPAAHVKHGFAALLLLVAGYTAWQSVDGLTSDSAPTATSAVSSATLADAADQLPAIDRRRTTIL
ncbi:sulfite exporter TauE/SafE family protein [Aeromicrobium sp. A1-2]|uniref:sulfite exporter TauE/SafE family protein n=1 Tax=Aeromicrobium sp. A1-2 TaxID=2107713 RepID=UPI000E50711F|nr:sulfite exporter TauE/SafE family protein [Aeromicrobium sp. A1-2]AXT85044.1 sulfite exporter TauE/SafE family protein [Aeromicrobium sp. A1-2]